MTGAPAPPLDNGAFIFDEPWQGRAFGLALVLIEQLGLPWEEFQRRLITAIADEPHRPYYESWAAAVESLAVDQDLVKTDQLDRAAAAI